MVIIVSLSFPQDFDDLSFGSDNTLDVLTWNIEWFPKNGQTTVNYVTEIIEALDMDVLAIQELDNTTLFDQMMNNLTDYVGYYESAWFAGLAYIYNTETIQINNIYEIYTTSPYWSAFPRSPMVMDMNFSDQNYILINNHFKCCGDGNLNLNDDGDEETRRHTASTLLKEYIDQNFPNSNVIVLGDLNDELTDNANNNVFQMIIDDPENYLFADMEIAEGPNSNWSFPNWPSHLDHILITNELFESNNYIETIRVDDYMSGGFSQYDQNISDHRPVAIRFQSSIGDLNSDDSIDILDVVLAVNLVLSSDYSNVADLNSDDVVDVLDIILLINLILN